MDLLFLKSRRLGADSSSPSVSGFHSPHHPTMGDNMAYTSGPLSAFNTKVIIVTACLLLVLILALLANLLSRWFLRRLLFSGSATAELKRKVHEGLKKDQLQSLPSTTYVGGGGPGNGQQSPTTPNAGGELAVAVQDEGLVAASLTQCPICLVDFRGGERIRVLPKCQHGFHVACIDRWLTKSSSCPTCRGDLMDNLP